jgi:hypothetical protein
MPPGLHAATFTVRYHKLAKQNEGLYFLSQGVPYFIFRWHTVTSQVRKDMRFSLSLSLSLYIYVYRYMLVYSCYIMIYMPTCGCVSLSLLVFSYV